MRLIAFTLFASAFPTGASAQMVADNRLAPFDGVAFVCRDITVDTAKFGGGALPLRSSWGQGNIITFTVDRNKRRVEGLRVTSRESLTALGGEIIRADKSKLFGLDEVASSLAWVSGTTLVRLSYNHSKKRGYFTATDSSYNSVRHIQGECQLVS
jgi:hypothetical protein